MVHSFSGGILVANRGRYLVIEAPSVSSQKLVTNDIVAFDGRGYFKVVGRKDNTINTGGVKVQIEQVEDVLRAHMLFPFMITSLPDVKFGECIVLLAEAGEEAGKTIEKAIELLPVYWQPKNGFFLSTFCLLRKQESLVKRLLPNVWLPV